MSSDTINATEVLWAAETKVVNTETFVTVDLNESFGEWVLVAEVTAIDATGEITLNVYTNQSGGSNWETIKAAAINITQVEFAAGTKVETYTFPDPTTKKLAAQVIRVGVAGVNLSIGTVEATFNVWLVRRV